MVNKKHDDPFVRFEQKLSDLAYEWRSTDDENVRKRIQQNYRRTLTQLFRNGWQDYLMPDAELPDKLMPRPYFERELRQVSPKAPIVATSVRRPQKPRYASGNRLNKRYL
jgi:hypothetical protein